MFWVREDISSLRKGCFFDVRVVAMGRVSIKTQKKEESIFV
jgi:hypothetical protein